MSTSFTLTATNALVDSVRATTLVTVLGKQSIVSTGSLLQPRHQHTATLLSDGRVLMSGGQGEGGVLALQELHVPRQEPLRP